MRILDKLTAREVTNAGNVSKITVDKVVRKWFDTEEIHEHVSGASKMIYDDDDRYMLCIIDAHPAATAEAFIEMMGSSAPQTHVTTMCHYRLMLGYTRRKSAIWVSGLSTQSKKDSPGQGSTRVMTIQSGCLWMKLLSVHKLVYQ